MRLTLKPILKGEEITVPASTGIGFVRVKATGDGLYAEDEENGWFFEASTVMDALSELEERAAKRGKAGKRAAPVFDGHPWWGRK